MRTVSAVVLLAATFTFVMADSVIIGSATLPSSDPFCH